MKNPNIKDMFDTIASGYDFQNRFLSFMIDAWWRKKMVKKWLLCVVFLFLVAGQSWALEMFPELEVTAQMGRFMKEVSYSSSGTRFFSKVAIDVGILSQDKFVLFTRFDYDTYFIESRRGLLEWYPWFCDYTN